MREHKMLSWIEIGSEFWHEQAVNHRIDTKPMAGLISWRSARLSNNHHDASAWTK